MDFLIIGALFILGASGALAVLQQILDGWSTYEVLQMGGSEKTDIVRDLMARIGVMPALVVLKGGAIALIVGSTVVSWFLAPCEQLLVGLMMSGLVAYYWPILRDNLTAYREMKARR